MINDIYELILGIYVGIMFFFLGWYSMDDYFSVFMEDSVLNKIFITFFIILFFTLSYYRQFAFLFLLHNISYQIGNFIRISFKV